ncbi:MAG: ATP-binding protein [bacterium]
MSTLTLEAKINNIPVLTDFIDQQLEALDCPMKPQMQIDVAVDEIFTNISSYAYGESVGTATVSVDFDDATRTVTISFEDSGMPFDPLTQEEPDITLPAEQRQIGGLGIFLVKKTMDDMRYQRQGDKNVLTIEKRI